MTGTISYNLTPVTSATVTEIRMPDPVLNIFNTKSQNLKAMNQVIWNDTDVYQDNITKTSNGSQVTGSFSPTTIDLSVPTSYINVDLKVPDDLIGVPFDINADVGTDNNVLTTVGQQYFTKIGTYTIPMAIAPDWRSTTFPWGVAGDAQWNLTVVATGHVIPINRTRLEIYALTRNLGPFFTNQIDVVLLRRAILPARFSGYNDWVDYTINVAFGADDIFLFQYDTDHGECRFADNSFGGDFKLKSWIAEAIVPKAPVNCFDQAGIVQIILSLMINGDSTWQLQEPFGYINQTALIGVGQCNSPFFSSRGTAQIVDNNNPLRSGFTSHAFVGVNSKGGRIADACVGPHVATEDTAQYIANAIMPAGTGQNQTDLYSRQSIVAQGVIGDVKQKAGVSSLDGGVPVPKALTATSEKLLGNAMDTAEMVANEASPFLNLDIAAIHDIMVNKSGRKVLDHDHTVSAGGSELSWLLDSDTVPTTVTVTVLSNHDNARLHFQHHLSKYQRKIEEVFTAPPTGMRKGQLCLTSPTTLKNHSSMIWVRGNVFARISTAASLDELEAAFGLPVDQIMQRGACEESEVKKPKILALNGPKHTMKVGKKFTISSSVSPPLAISVFAKQITTNNSPLSLLSPLLTLLAVAISIFYPNSLPLTHLFQT